ncbi:MAG: ArsR/SmtB family transcription factor [Gemmataceae bacterium]
MLFHQLVKYELTQRQNLLFHDIMKHGNADGGSPAKAPGCKPDEHHHAAQPRPTRPDLYALDRAARLFRAMGDPQRLALLAVLAQRECCVTELVEVFGDKFSTISQRLKLLRAENLIVRRREGTHLFYQLADAHVARLVADAIDHAAEPTTGPMVSKPELEDDE